MSLGQKGKDMARKPSPQDSLFRKTAPDAPLGVPAATEASPAGENPTKIIVRKGFHISQELDDRLRYYCVKNRIKSEVDVFRAALEQYLPPEVPKEWKS